jgi:hypothetical protein
MVSDPGIGTSNTYRAISRMTPLCMQNRTENSDWRHV